MNESIDGVKPRKFIFYIASLNRSVGENSQNDIDVKVHLYDNCRRKISSISSNSPSLHDSSVSIVLPSSQDDFGTSFNPSKNVSYIATVGINITNPTYSYICVSAVQRRRRNIKTNILQSFQKLETTFSVEVDLSKYNAALKTKEICLGAFDSALPAHTGTTSTSLEIIAVLFKTMHPERKTLSWAFFPTSHLFLMGPGNVGINNPQKSIDRRLMTVVQSIDAMKMTKRDTVHFIDDLLHSSELLPKECITEQQSADTLISSNTSDNVNASHEGKQNDNTFPLKLKKELMECEEKVTDSLNEIWNIVRKDMERVDSRLSETYRYSSKCLNTGDSSDSKSDLNHFKAYNHCGDNLNSNNDAFKQSSMKTRMALKSLRDSLQKDFLVTDDNESSMKKILQEKELSTQMAYLLRDMQLLQQRQQEIVALINSPSQSKIEEESTQFDVQPKNLQDGLTCSKEDPFVQEFLQFTKSVEQASQLSGASFRRLQQALHYPESFPSLCNHFSFPSSRKLLEFVTSEKATAFIRDLEQLAGVWRSAGTGIATDPMGINVLPLSDKKRAPWWQTRPLKPAL